MPIKSPTSILSSRPSRISSEMLLVPPSVVLAPAKCGWCRSCAAVVPSGPLLPLPAATPGTHLGANLAVHHVAQGQRNPKCAALETRPELRLRCLPLRKARLERVRAARLNLGRGLLEAVPEGVVDARRGVGSVLQQGRGSVGPGRGETTDTPCGTRRVGQTRPRWRRGRCAWPVWRREGESEL